MELIEGKKTCKNCKETKKLSDFNTDRSYRSGLRARCRVCMNAVRAPQTRRANLKRIYGLTTTDFDKMMNEQKGVCAICKQPESHRGHGENVKSLAVDHDHETGVIRGLLCNKCNRALGLFRDNAALLRNAQNYLEGSRYAR